MRGVKPFPKNTKVGDWRKLTKIQVAEAQLNTAIRLYFTSDDYVSVHSLWFAAASIIDSLLKLNGHEELLCPDAIRPEARDMWLATQAEAPNFFKHSGKDPNKTLDFLPANDEFNLFLACNGLKLLTGRETREMMMIAFWVLGRNPHLWSKKCQDLYFGALMELAPTMNRGKFYELMMSSTLFAESPKLP